MVWKITGSSSSVIIVKPKKHVGTSVMVSLYSNSSPVGSEISYIVSPSLRHVFVFNILTLMIYADQCFVKCKISWQNIGNPLWYPSFATLSTLVTVYNGVCELIDVIATIL